jgi:hypothetical protein
MQKWRQFVKILGGRKVKPNLFGHKKREFTTVANEDPESDPIYLDYQATTPIDPR